MATAPVYTYSGVVYVGDGSKVQFALTSSAGKAIGYLLPEHIAVSISTDDGGTWTVLDQSTDYSFSTQGTQVTLNTPPAVGAWVKIKRTTPLDTLWVDYQAGNLLTAGQLNEFENWQLYIDQELADDAASLESDIPTSVVSQIVAGSNVTISPSDGKGVVTISSTGGGGGGGPADTDELPEGSVNLYYTDARVESYVSGAGYIKDAGVTKLVAGNNIVLTPSGGTGIVTVESVGGGAITYMGLIDATGAAPAGPRNGDMYVNTATSGVVDASWTGIAGQALTGNERLVYSTDTSTWGMIRDFGVPEAPSDGSLYARQDQGWTSFTIPTPVQSDWNESDTADLAFIKNKPTIPVVPAPQDLQSVTDEGNSTTHKIQAAGFRVDLLTTLP